MVNIFRFVLFFKKRTHILEGERTQLRIGHKNKNHNVLPKPTTKTFSFKMECFLVLHFQETRDLEKGQQTPVLWALSK